MAIPESINHQDYLLTVNVNEETPVHNPLDGSQVLPLFLDPDNGTWVLYTKFPPGTKLPRHFHTGTVHVFTTKGRWHYVEYPDDVQTPGSYLYEPGGSIHQFVVPEDAEEAVEGFMVVTGANVNFEDDGTFRDITDAGAIERLVKEVCSAMGRPTPRYIRPNGTADFAPVEEPAKEDA